MLRRPWTVAQFTIAAVLLVVSLVGIIGLAVFDAPELTFSFQGWIQSFAIFPGLVISLGVNGLFMGVRRAPAPSLTLKWLLGLEFALIAALLLFHFYTDPAGNTFGLAVLAWPVVIVLAVIIAVVAAVRLFQAPPAAAPEA